MQLHLLPPMMRRSDARGPLRRSLVTAWRVVLFAAVLGAAACGAAAPTPAVPRGTTAGLSGAFLKAMQAEASDPTAATGYLDVIDAAIAAPDDPWAVAAVAASLDALLWRRVHEVDGAVAQAVAYRSRSALVETASRLRHGWSRARQADPLLGGLLAAGLHHLALLVGRSDSAARWRERSGCATAATIAGPIAWPPLSGLKRPSPVPAHGPLPAHFDGVKPFAAKAPLEPVAADACAINTDATSTLRGVRAVVVDIQNPRRQRLTVTFTSSSAARIDLAGERLLSRAYAAGGEPVTLAARAMAEPGRLRLVARVADNLDGQAVRIAIWGEDGKPVSTLAPVAGERAAGTVSEVEPLVLVPAATSTRPAELVLAAAALLALGEGRAAVERFEDPAAPAPARRGPMADLLHLRAIQTARHLPRNQRLIEIQSIVARARKACEGCWEPRIVQAAVRAERRGYAVGVFTALEDLEVDPQAAGWTEDRTVVELAYLAITAYRAGLLDVARQSYRALDDKASGSALLAAVDAQIHRRIGDELIQAACAGGTNRSGARCLYAHIAQGKLAPVLAEIQRLRQLRGSPELHRDTELSQLLAHGQIKRALGVYQAMPPARRSVGVLGAVLALQREPERWLERARVQFERDMLRARDAPFGYEPLARILGVVKDRSSELEQRGRELVAQDRADAFLPGAGTAVLRRVEDYHLEPSGLLHYWFYDLRRVSGTTDVARGVWSGGPTIAGRSVIRQLRRRIHKQDGRVLDPDPTARGAQGHTDLSQLEAGDYVEAITEGWALPDDSGQLVVDSSDLLPLRTSVREATVRFSRPADLELSLWTHRLLGKPESHREGKRLNSTWRLQNQAPRRMEEGVPPLEARVGLSFGTDRWDRIARSIGERLASLDERDGFMGRWVHEAVGDETDRRKQIARVVAAVGKEIRRADASALSDFVASLGGGAQRETARHLLEQGQGSRTWVVHRALRELGLNSRVAISESRPFSAAPNFPPRPGRFSHPLVMVEVDGERLWIDADVDGPPLPPGRISPELRGRKALLGSGEMLTVEGAIGVEPDEIDIRLKVDEHGDASGTFTALIQGRPAQQLTDAFEVQVGSQRTKLLRNVVLGWVPWADVREVTLSSEEGAWQIAVRASIAVPGFARPEGRKGQRWSLPGLQPLHAVYPGPRTSTLRARYAAQGARTTALAIDRPLLFHVHRRIELPPKAKVVRPAEGLQVESDFLTASRVVSHGLGAIEEDFRLNLPVGTVGAERFEQFLTDIRQVDDGFMFGTQIQVEAKPAPQRPGRPKR